MLKSCFERTAAFFREHMAVTKWSVCFFLMCACLLVSGSEPTEPFVKQIFSLVQFIGFFVITVLIVIDVMKGTLEFVLLFLIRSLSIYLMVLWLIGIGGDAIYSLALAHPNDAAAFVIAFIIVHTIVRFVSLDSTTAITGLKMPKPTAHDNRYTAAHEAGHALVYAALEHLPPDVKAVLNDVPGHNGVLGFVTGINSQRQLDEKTFIEWNMLVLLAGKMGETKMTGESTQLGRDDHAHWLGMANSYLSNHYQGIFYFRPQNELELKSNEEKLFALQTGQSSMLSQLFDQNIDVFRELADTLLKKRVLLCDELTPFLARVRLPEGFPRPNLFYEDFSTRRKP